MAIDLQPEDLLIVQEILARHVPDCEVRVFGSRINGLAKAFSDLDLVIVCAEPLSRELLGRIEFAFEDSYLPFRVDVLDWWDLDEAFRTVIQNRNEKILF